MSNIDEYKKLRDEFGRKLEPAVYDVELASWNFYTNSNEENLKIYTEAQDKISDLYKNKELYNKLEDIKTIGFDNKNLTLQIKKLTRDFYEEIEFGKEMKSLRDKENSIADKFNSHVMKIDGKSVSKAEIIQILETEKDIKLREKAYNENVNSGDVIADELIELVKMRNSFAKTKGYDNYFEYIIDNNYDITPSELEKLLGGVYERVKDKCHEFTLKKQKELSEVFGIEISELRGYHYGLLSKNTPEGEANEYLKSNRVNIEDIAIRVYKNMGFDVKNMGITLDLYPRKNKNTHGFAFCVKAGKDARILANLTQNLKSLDTLLHELGHCVYDIGISTDLPFLERDCSSPVMTEAVAMMMGDLIKTEPILKEYIPEKTLNTLMAEISEDNAKFVARSLQIINFEKEMYKNPEQDLKQLWRDMKIKYLFRGNNNSELNNEWATIPHYLSHPGYYQNYFRASLLKAQIYNSMKKELGYITQNHKSASYLNEKLFKFGASIYEPDLIKSLTGKPLSEDDFCSSIGENI